MSRLDLTSLGITSVTKSLEVLTFFFYPGEGKRSSRGVVSYKRKKEGKTDAPEQYLQIVRSVSEVEGKQVLSFYLGQQSDKSLVATFEFTSTSATLIPEELWDMTKSWIVIPTDPSFDYMVKDTLSAVFDGWLESERFEEYLERQAENLTFNTGFTKAILLYMSYLANRDEKKPNGDVQVTTEVDLNAVAKTYTHLLTRLHNTSPRTKKLFPIQQLLEPAKPLKVQQEEIQKIGSSVEVVSDEPKEETDITLEHLPDTSLPVDVTPVESEDKPEEPTQPKNKKK